MRLRCLFIFTVFTLFTAACSSPGAAAQKSQETTAEPAGISGCTVTRPPKQPFIPPQPWPALPPDSQQFWYGDAGLWTALPKSGSWPQLAVNEKFWWWSEEYDASEEPVPALMVTARRLDGEAPTYQASRATNGYHESFNWAMLVGVDLPSPGCWVFTGQYNGRQLSFVLWVPPE